MKQAIKRLLFALVFLALPFMMPTLSHAQAYQFQVISVTSSSTPVNILLAGQRTTWDCKTLSSAAGPVDVWAYTGSLPGSKPTNYSVINVGDSKGDSIPASDSSAALQQPWAAVLDSGSSAVTVFCEWR